MHEYVIWTWILGLCAYFYMNTRILIWYVLLVFIFNVSLEHIIITHLLPISFVCFLLLSATLLIHLVYFFILGFRFTSPNPWSWSWNQLWPNSKQPSFTFPCLLHAQIPQHQQSETIWCRSKCSCRLLQHKCWFHRWTRQRVPREHDRSCQSSKLGFAASSTPPTWDQDHLHHRGERGFQNQWSSVVV